MDYKKLMAGEYQVKEAGIGGALTGAATGALAASWIPIPGARIAGGLIGGLIGAFSGGGDAKPGDAAGPQGSGGGVGGTAAKTLSTQAPIPPMATVPSTQTGAPPAMNTPIGPSEEKAAEYLPILRVMEGMEKEAIAPFLVAGAAMLGRGAMALGRMGAVAGRAGMAAGRYGLGAASRLGAGLFRGGAGAKATSGAGSTISKMYSPGSSIQNVTKGVQTIKIPPSAVTRMPSTTNLTPAVMAGQSSQQVGQALRTIPLSGAAQGAAAQAAPATGIGGKLMTAAMWAPMFMGGGSNSAALPQRYQPQFMRA